jgi:thiol-disulfide isomerase/thioredoxin
MKYSWLVVVCILLAGCIGQGPVPSGEPEESLLPSEPEGPQMYENLTDDQILELVSHSSPVIIYVYASTCSSCFTVEPLLRELQAQYNVDIIWVDKIGNKAIFSLYQFFYYPALYVYSDSEVLITFDAHDSLTGIYSQILDNTVVGIHRIDHTIEENQLIIPTENLLPDVLYYINYENHRVFVYISAAARLFVFSGSQNCETHWLYLKKDLLYDGENYGRWNRETLAKQGGGCGELIQIPYTITGTAIIIDIGDIRWR